MQSDPPPLPGAALVHLTPEEIRTILHHLRGVQFVEVRQYGGPPELGAEIVTFLEADGRSVTFREIFNITPPPLRRLVFRYAGSRAELTIAYDVPM